MLPAEKPDFDRWISKGVRTSEHWEVLLLTRSEAGRDWSANDVSAVLRIDPISASNLLAELHARGLLQRSGIRRLYRYVSCADVVERAIDEQLKRNLSPNRDAGA